MHILLSNDDGFIAPGINVLRERLSQFANVLTISPDRDRSGSSNSLTLDRPLRLVERGEQFYSVNGTPTDCVHLALTGIYQEEPDIVISGVNNGPNMGDDVIYSGTVAAAMEGRNLGLPSLAVSINAHQPDHLETAVEAVVSLLNHLSTLPGNFSSGDNSSTNSSMLSGLNRTVSNWASILNVNVPDIPWQRVKGFRSTRLGRRHKAEPVIRSHDPRGNEIFWVGPVGAEEDAGEGTDFHAVQHDYVSVTPLQIDLTRHAAIQSTADWLETL